SRWHAAFGSHIKYAIWNKDYALLTSHGLAQEDRRALLTVMAERRCRETWEPFPAFAGAMYWPSIMHLFGGSTSFLEHNPVSLKTIRFRGEHGQLLTGPLFPGMALSFAAFQDLKLASETASVGSVPCAGFVTLFVPHKTIGSSQWLKKALALPAVGLDIPRVHLTTWRRLRTAEQEIPGLTPELARSVAVEAKRISEGAILDASMRGVVFIREAGWKHTLALHTEQMRRPFRLARSPVMPALFLLLLAAIPLALSLDMRGSIATGLFRQCLVICVVVSCIPVTGLVWTGLIGSQSRFDFQRADAMQRLEERLEQLEASHASFMSGLIKPIRKLLDDPAWRKGMRPIPEIASAVAQLKYSFLNTLYVIDPNGNPHDFAPGLADPARSEIKQAHKLMTALLQFIFSTLISREASSGESDRQNLQREIRGGMIYDIFALAVSPETVYQLAITFDRLMPFQVFHETTSVIFHEVLDESMNPTMLLFTVMNRKFMIQQELTHAVNHRITPGQSVPPVVLQQNMEGEWPIVLPVSPSMEPVMYLLLQRLRSEGGNIRTRLPVNGIPCHVLARPLTGMEMIGAALEPVGQEAGMSLPPAVFAAAYPVAIVILALLLFQSFFLKPVSEMRKTVEAIAAGDYGQRLPVLTDDEIGSLCLSFNTMAKDLAEKEFLRRFISDLTMQAVAGRHRRTATRLTATVMFTDIRGFTTMSETQPPEKITAMLNEYLTRMEAMIEAHGGTIDKFIGDAIMAVFLPTHGMAPSGERAIRAAFGMRQELTAFNAIRRAAGEFEIAIGSGIATGKILMGVLGRSDGRQDFTVTGPTVNISASMEKRSKETRRTPIVACPATVEAAFGHLVMEPLPEIPGKPAGFELVSIADSEVSLSHSDT
ncbi:HAMP domain-containing protein, partial [Candidatus Ozemobacteraceae bacterium]|nr:HAMP domain-containing protein [Candidatus Ozemobacteraceae bacterium]